MSSSCRILIVKLSSLGDILQTTPILEPLRRQIPKASVDWMVFGDNVAVLLNNPYLNRIVLCHRWLLGVWGCALAVWRGHYDVVVIAHRSRWLGLFFALLRVPIRIGFVSEGASNRFLTHEVVYDLTVSRLSRVSALVRELGVDVVFDGVRPVYRRPASTLAGSQVLESDDVTVVLAPFGARNRDSEMPSRRWHYYPELIRLIRRSYPTLTVVIVGGAEDASRTELDSVLDDEQVVDVRGCLSVAQLATVIHRAVAFVGNDSFPLYMALAQDTPSIGVFGPTDSQIVLDGYRGVTAVQSEVMCSPCYDPVMHQTSLAYRCPYSYACMKAVSPGRVFGLVQALIGD